MTDPAHPTSDGTLADAIDRLVKVGGDAGITEDQVRAEALAVSAAVVETGGPSRAPHSWAAQVGMPVGVFFEQAPRGRRFLSGATPTVSRLAGQDPAAAAVYLRALTRVAEAASAVEGAPVVAAERVERLRAAQGSATADVLSEGFAGGFPPVFPGGGSALHDRVLADARRVQEQLAAMGRVPGVSLPVPSVPAVPSTPAGEDVVGSSVVSPSPEAAGGDRPVEAQEEHPERSLDELLGELDALIGLAAVKREVHRQVALLAVEAKRERAGLRSAPLTRHLVFVGNPGTGKTTVARLVGGIYRAMGLLSTGQLVEVDRSELVAGYLGQTAQKTTAVVESALGGVLFIDEAYTLKGDQYAQEAVDTLVKEMEDHRDDLVVIVAGYPDPMAEFIASNPGLSSRFRTTITFADYDDDEIVGILGDLAGRNDYDLTDQAVSRFREILAAEPRGSGFGNGRFARNTLEAAIGRHAWRLRDIAEPTLAELRTLERSDLEDRPDDDLPPLVGGANRVRSGQGELG
ncbi:ATPase family associated with various cellular activities (AAA) [Austwickia chelonae]|uniref:Putative ATPase n=1 Tax=Austwickia chelonae NBRC 105200 TaxID=1184607 RepID=K6UN25_9MICO|nr:AAA family ATPase [Austwickia chelonae]GAB78626.1 putative ATPase [Austwickia chelonae NBRC 105200]SEW34220.1 ATPase family associated with various cellular activities (AAA) [Austwickia chelonae]